MNERLNKVEVDWVVQASFYAGTKTAKSERFSSTQSRSGCLLTYAIDAQRGLIRHIALIFYVWNKA